MTTPTPRPNDVIADRLLVIQHQIGQMQADYRDANAAFWAIALAWEATTCAWYVVSQNSLEKLPSVRQALARLERRQ
jgi:hypothetical protein